MRASCHVWETGMTVIESDVYPTSFYAKTHTDRRNKMTTLSLCSRIISPFAGSFGERPRRLGNRLIERLHFFGRDSRSDDARHRACLEMHRADNRSFNYNRRIRRSRLNRSTTHIAHRSYSVLLSPHNILTQLIAFFIRT